MASSNSSKNRRPIARDSFLEALRDLGKGVVSDVKDQFTQAVTQDIPTSFGYNQPSGGSLKPNESFSMTDIMAAERRGEQRAETGFNSRLSQVREEERQLHLRRENEAKSKIKNIQDEIKMLAKSIGDFSKEVQVAALQAPANPGVYHENFFEQLRAFIRLMRQKIQNSRHWLATQNQRSQKKKGMYWNNVQKSGTKYMLSSERYMVTTTG